MRLTDLLMVRVLSITVVFAVIFAVLRPLIWKWIFNEDPPRDISDLGTILSIVIAILGLGLASFGFIVYRLVRDEMTRDVESRIQKSFQVELAQKSLSLSLERWERYELELWSPNHYSSKIEHDLIFRHLVDLAIDEGERALKSVRVLPDRDPYRGDQYRDLHYWNEQECINNLAYHYATRRSPGDKDNACNLIDLLTENEPSDLSRISFSRPGTSYFNPSETMAWVYLRFGVKVDRGKEIVNRLITDHKYVNVHDRLKTKYTNACGMTFSTETSIGAGDSSTN